MKQNSNVFVCPDNKQFKNENNDTKYVTNNLQRLRKRLKKKNSVKKVERKSFDISKALRSKGKNKKRREKKKKKSREKKKKKRGKKKNYRKVKKDKRRKRTSSKIRKRTSKNRKHKRKKQTKHSLRLTLV